MTPTSRLVIALAATVILSLPPAAAQSPGRVATSTSALVAAPLFFHGKQIALYGSVEQVGQQGRLQVPVDEAALKLRRIPQIFVFWREQPSRSEGEIRGEFWDLGRIDANDGRFTQYDFKPMLEAVTQGRWPAREELYVVLGATMVESPLPATATLRSIVLAPDKHAGRDVTISGRFRGRNLYADLPSPLNRGKWDFILQSADSALWVTGIPPKGKGFDLDPGTRSDTGRWLKATGTVRTEGATVWLDAKTLELSAAPEETTIDLDVPPPPKAPPPTVIFSAPIADEVAVETNTEVRIQFSWDMDQKTFRGRVRVSYVPAPDGTSPRAPEFTTIYNQGNRALIIRFAKPLEPQQTLKVELLEGILAMGGQPLAPWTLTFSTGS
jgi:hypothetical protein